MKSINESEHLYSMSRMFVPDLGVSEIMSRNACRFWQNQEKVLESMHAFSSGWFERRHTGISATVAATKHMCKAKTPVDAFREYRQSASGVFQRGMVDVFACHQQFMTIAGAVAPPLSQMVGKTTQPSHNEAPSASGSKAA